VQGQVALLASTLQRYLPLHRFVAPATLPAAAATTAAAPEPAGLDQGLLADFLRTTHEDIAALREALANGDTGAITREAHRIKGASGLVGATALAAVATRIEAAGRAEQIEPLADLLRELESEVANFASRNGLA
jgi:HPt (histidine-containing phosphotransfer) domain-containing protein